nr:EamA family transporter [Prevotella sp.]
MTTKKTSGKVPLQAHISIIVAEMIWGLMAPIGKDAMTHGIDGISMVSFRVLGGAVLFWIASFFVKSEHVPIKDIILLGCAGIFGLVCNQCLFTIGLSLTSPIDASIVTTTMPIFAMILSFFILKEPITIKKSLGVFIGCCGAIILILSSATAVSDKVGNISGDLMCLGAELAFALYLSLFNNLVKKYSVFTVNKWMFLWATLLIWPFSGAHVMDIQWQNISTQTWLETGYVVFFGTFIGYILIMISQRTLRPTVVSIYNYVQPIVAVTVSILTGIGVFTLMQGIAVIFVFSGVWLVIKSKSKRDMQKVAET